MRICEARAFFTRVSETDSRGPVSTPEFTSSDPSNAGAPASLLTRPDWLTQLREGRSHGEHGNRPAPLTHRAILSSLRTVGILREESRDADSVAGKRSVCSDVSSGRPRWFDTG